MHFVVSEHGFNNKQSEVKLQTHYEVKKQKQMTNSLASTDKKWSL